VNLSVPTAQYAGSNDTHLAELPREAPITASA